MGRRFIVVAAAALAAYLLFFFGMSDRGLVGPDEPRYASIAREMADSGDWVTPRLAGEPWFEKPALLFWMGALAAKLGLDGDRATRLPVAVVSVVFLMFFYRRGREQFGSPAAEYATLILATSTGWVAYSQIGVFDMPLTAVLAAALLVILPWVERSDEQSRRTLPWFGLLLGLSALAKGLVGPALAALALLSVCVDRGVASVLRDLMRPRVWLPFLAAAAPWYVLCYAANGTVFLEEFFWRHHFERLASESIQHVQPFWYLIPILLAGLLPWTPLLLLRPGGELRRDPRLRFLLTWIFTTVLLFSISTNKLPGYLLPAFPALALWMGVQLARRRWAKKTLVAASLLLFPLPVVEAVLPEAISYGLTNAWPPEHIAWGWLSGAFIVAAAVWWAAGAGKTLIALLLVALGTVAGLTHLKIRTFPAIDREAGTRKLWTEKVESRLHQTCIGDVRRHVVYGLQYYSHDRLPPCAEDPHPYQVQSDPPRLIGPEPKDLP